MIEEMVRMKESERLIHIDKFTAQLKAIYEREAFSPFSGQVKEILRIYAK